MIILRLANYIKNMLIEMNKFYLVIKYNIGETMEIKKFKINEDYERVRIFY